MIGHVHHRVHQMLDHDQRDALFADFADHVQHLGDFLRIQTGEHFVQQDHQRTCGERPRQLQTLLLRHVEFGRQHGAFRRQADELQHFIGHWCGGLQR